MAGPSMMDKERQGNMPRRRYTAEEIIGNLREAEVLLSQGQSVGQVSRSLAISEQTYYRWRKEYKVCAPSRLNVSRRSSRRTAGSRGWLRISPWTTPCCERRSRETDQPGKTTAGGAALAADPCRFGTLCLPGSRSATLQPTLCSAAFRSGRTVDRGHHRPGDAVWPVWLPTHHNHAAVGWMARESQADRAHLAPGRPESAPEAAQAGPTVAEQRIMHPASSPAPEACLELRLCG